jgi:hypothetical protein
MVRILVCLIVCLAVGSLLPSRSWSDPIRPTYDIPHEFENSGDDDLPNAPRPGQGRQAQPVEAPVPPNLQHQQSRSNRTWIVVFLDDVRKFILHRQQIQEP